MKRSSLCILILGVLSIVCSLGALGSHKLTTQSSIGSAILFGVGVVLVCVGWPRDDDTKREPILSLVRANFKKINPKFENDHAIIHFESSEPSFFGGASGHVAHHYVIHDLSVIDGIHIKQGAWGTATSMTTERKILGNKKKLGDLYGKTEARVQTTINVTHF